MLKFWIKTKVLPYFTPLISRLITWEIIGKHLGIFSVFCQARSIMSKSSEFGGVENNQKNIVMLTMIGGHSFTLNTEIIFGLMLRWRGYNVEYVIDDCQLPITEHYHINESENWAEISQKDFKFGKRLLSIFNFNYLTVSELTSEVSREIDVEEFNHIIEASLLKHYRVGVLSEGLPNLINTTERIRTSVSLSAKTGYSILEMEPFRVISSHGIYSTWGPAFDILVRNGIDVVSYEKGKKRNKLRFNWSLPADTWDISNEWERTKNNALNESQESKIDKYIQSRISHKYDIKVYNFGELETTERTFERFSLDPCRPVFTLFTNVLWDAASAQKEIVFKNSVEWVIKTIKWFEKNEDKQLLIKIHPAEVVIGTKQPFKSIIEKNFQKLPENVTVISPHEEVNSWSIYPITTIGLVHTSTVGLEMPIVNVPCIVVSNAHYRGKGFTIDTNSKDEYFNIISNYQKYISENQSISVLAKRYAYLIFERYQIPFNVFKYHEDTMDVVNYRFKTIEELSKDKYINFIIDCIENKSEFILSE